MKSVLKYEVEGNTYIQFLNWKRYQKIDRPSPSKYPKFDESSTIVRRRLDSNRIEENRIEEKRKNEKIFSQDIKKIKHKDKYPPGDPRNSVGYEAFRMIVDLERNK